jgi:hypothetical protein
MRKSPGVACRHLVPGGGCGIHATRPDVCRHYHCAWHHLSYLDDSWRPDLSGVLIEFQDVQIPEGYGDRSALRLSIVGPIETVFKRGFLNLVVHLVGANIPAFLCIRGPSGHYPVNTFLNNVLIDAVRAQDMGAIARKIGGLITDLAGVQYMPAKFEHMNAPDFGVSISEGLPPG